ncbi:MAG: hypothetical protein P8J50_00995 [Acidimicrobiales bacterium]|jgi:hypothetical protein|nr:hypothetical protein [Acidimicrobiales bacterium]
MRPALVLLVLLAACSVNADPEESGPPSTAPPTVVTTTTEPLPPSTALIRIGTARYELDAVCAAVGAGEVEVTGVGTDEAGQSVFGYVRAFLNDPYVALLVGNGDDAVLYEPGFDGLPEVELTDDGARFADVQFATDVDIENLTATPVDAGAVEVICGSYVRELPPSPFSIDAG